jgi:Tail tubular protein
MVLDNFQTSRLQAVNIILSNIGQAPVTTLRSGNVQAEMAENLLDEITKAVQSEGWVFNTEVDYPIVPDSTKHCKLPPNVLTWDGVEYNAADLIIRDGKLYDKRLHTFEFEKTIYVNVVWYFPFEELPESFRNYITIRAANVFAGRTVGSSEAVRFGQQEESIARATCLELETQQGDYTFFGDRTGRTSYQSYLPYQAVTRSIWQR